MNVPKIIPGTFKSEKPLTNLEWRETVPGKVMVEFEGKQFEVDGEFIAGVEIIYALGFVSGTRTGKYTYKAAVSYRVQDDEHLCQLGGGLNAHFIRYEPAQTSGRMAKNG